MKVSLNSTTKIVNLNGVPARVWEGETDSGIRVHAFVTRIAVDGDEDCAEFEKELLEHDPPSPDIENYPLRIL